MMADGRPRFDKVRPYAAICRRMTVFRRFHSVRGGNLSKQGQMTVSFPARGGNGADRSLTVAANLDILPRFDSAGQ